MGTDALRAMGLPDAQATRVAETFRAHERKGMVELARVYGGDKEAFTSTARRHIQNLQNVFRSDEGPDAPRPGAAAESAPPPA